MSCRGPGREERGHVQYEDIDVGQSVREARRRILPLLENLLPSQLSVAIRSLLFQSILVLRFGGQRDGANHTSHQDRAQDLSNARHGKDVPWSSLFLDLSGCKK